MKNANVSNVLVIVIIVLATLTILLFFIDKYRSWASTLTDEEICRNSVLAQGTARMRGVKFTVNEIKCPTQYTTIDAKTDYGIKKAIANNMAKCWWMFGEGAYRIFEETDQNFCVVCYVMDFKEKKQLTGLTNFLASEKLPSNQLFPSRDITYQTYLTGYSTEGEILPLIQQDVVNTNEEQAVMFTYSKKIFWDKVSKGSAYGGVGLVGGAVAGALGIILTPFTGGTSLIVAAAIIGGTAGAVGGAYAGVHMAEADWASGVLLIPYRNDAIQELGCEELQ